MPCGETDSPSTDKNSTRCSPKTSGRTPDGLRIAWLNLDWELWRIEERLKDITFHYPPELFGLLVDTIPLLCRSKEDTLLFIKGAGVGDALIADLWQIVRTDRSRINKYEIVRTTLTRLNEQSETALRPRREVLKRVLEFEEFAACWDAERLKAQGMVAQLQKLVKVKDSFTRMKQQRDEERQTHMAERDKEQSRLARRARELETVKQDFYALFAEQNPILRGKQLECVLNRLFACFEIAVRESFSITGDEGEGVVEQIDGVIEMDGHLYFVEMKWWRDPVGVPEISQHMMRVFLRAEARALIISASDFTAPAVATCKEALSQKVVSLCTLRELVALLDAHGDLRDFLRRKVRATIMDKNPCAQASYLKRAAVPGRLAWDGQTMAHWTEHGSHTAQHAWRGALPPYPSTPSSLQALS